MRPDYQADSPALIDLAAIVELQFTRTAMRGLDLNCQESAATTCQDIGDTAPGVAIGKILHMPTVLVF